MQDQFNLDSDAMALGFRDHSHRLSARRLRRYVEDDDDEERQRMDRQAHEDSAADRLNYHDDEQS